MKFLPLFLLCSLPLVGEVFHFKHARLVSHHAVREGELWVKDGKIAAPQEKADRTVDVGGALIAPGYIDLQMNGGFGIDFTQNPEKVAHAARQLPQYGVTSFLPTLVSATTEEYRKALPLLQPKSFGKQGASILGIHLEGPFFSKTFSCAHGKELVRSEGSSPEELYGCLEGVKLVTLAPEIPGAESLIQFFRKKQIVVAAGHSNATQAQMQAAVHAGLGAVTHLFNAMRPFHHREPGIIGSALLYPRLYYSMIIDGIHTSPEAISLAWHCHPEGLFLITDATAALGLPNGKHHLGAMEIEVKDGRVCLVGTETLAGSRLSMDEAVRRLRAVTHCPIALALEAASQRPAQILGLYPQKGSLEISADADFLILDDDLYVQATYIGGEAYN